MANENQPPAAAPAASVPVIPPAPPTAERVTVPASAVFDADDMALSPSAMPAKAEDKAAEAAAASAKPAAAAAPAAPAKDDKAAAAAPAAPAKADEPKDDKAAAAAPAAPAKADEPKVKVGGKEYTVAELEAALNKSKLPEQSAAAAAPAAQAKPEVKQPTPEEISQQETEWRNEFVKQNKISIPFSKEETEALLEGGEDAAKLVSQKLTDAVAHAVLLTRKSVFADLNPYFERANAAMLPIMEQQQQLERIATEQEFVRAYPEFKEHLDTARQVAAALVEQYPAETSKMARPDFLREVSIQADRIIQANYSRFNPAASGSWRDAAKSAPAAQPAAAAPAAQPAAQPAAAAAAPASPVVQPPNANSPAAVPTSAPGMDWHKQTAQSLVD